MTESKNFQLSITDRQAVITFDLIDARVNILTPAVMRELDLLLDKLGRMENIDGAIIISAKKDNFIAGADIKVIQELSDADIATQLAKEGQLVMDKIAALPFPVVAAINGSCLGGGLELALACDYRIAANTKKTFLGLPETKLGIIPGFGGTQRLPRLIGIMAALRLITTGAKVFPKKALHLGLVDEVVDGEHLMDAAAKILGRGKRGLRPLRQKLFTKLLENNPLGRKFIFSQAHKNVLKTAGDHYPAPLAAVDAISHGIAHGMGAGLAYEARTLGQMAVTPESKNLIRVFQLQERFTRVDKDPAMDIARLGVVGAGVMGGGIMGLAAERGFAVRLLSLTNEEIRMALAAFNKAINKKKRKGIYSQFEAAGIANRITYSTEVGGLRQSGAVIEAVLERMDVKKKLFADLEKNVADDALILSNTSSLSITEMAADMRHPGRVAGLHFFNPADRMQLVEIVKGEKTTETTMLRLQALAARLGKMPIRVQDSPGFLVNRLLLPYLNEAARMLEEGATISAIDRALLNFGMPMGAFILLDIVGLDIAAHVGDILQQGLGERLAPSAIITAMRDDKRLGKKNGRGFYNYRHHKRNAAPEVGKIIAPYINNTNTLLSPDDLSKRPIYLMINEAAHCLHEGVIAGPAEVDAAMIFGAGFPPFTGGLLRYADLIGIKKLVATLADYAAKYGDRFNPAELLVKMEQDNRPFYHD